MSIRKSCLVAAAAAALLPFASCNNQAWGSSHREAPNITRMPTADSTDFYLFNSYEPGRDGFVTLLANYIPLQQPYGGPNYFAMDPAVLYEIHIDNDGDANENLTFQSSFNNRLANDNRGIKLNIAGPNVAVPLKIVGPVSSTDSSALNFRESYQVWLTRGDRRKGNAQAVTGGNGGTVFGKPYDFVGTKTFGSIAAYKTYANSFIYTMNIPGCGAPGRVFVGQRKQGFAVNLGPVEGDSAPGAGDGGGFPGGITQSSRNNQVDNANVTTIALEVHKSCLAGSGNGVIGGWTSASMRQARLLNPVPTFARPEVDCARTAERLHPRHETLRVQAVAWLALERARGDSVHAREAALLALDGGDAGGALKAAQANFRAQKELADVRLLARAAVAAHDPDARQQLLEWLRRTRYRDAVTENILDRASAG